MDFDLFKKEKEVIETAQNNLVEEIFQDEAKTHFENLLDEYKKLSKHVKRLIKLSDLNEKSLRDAHNEINQQKKELERRQDELVQAEKMASLGQLVAGVAHELNTPLGIMLTASSSLRVETNQLNDLLANNKVKKSNLVSYMATASEAAALIERHSQNASELITSFKSVSVDQSIDEKRTIKLGHYLKDIVRSLKPSFTDKDVKIRFEFRHDIEIETYPGPLAQVVNNLILNAYQHGFNKDEDNGEITINFSKHPADIRIQIIDNGKGIAPEIKDRLFDPFVTTARNNGGTGLGLHIVHNIVVAKLSGSVSVQHNKSGPGCCFEITLPLTIRGDKT